MSNALSWTLTEDGKIHVRTNAVPVKTLLEGSIRIACVEGIEQPLFVTAFDFQENQKTWRAKHPYTNIEELLQDLVDQTRNDLANPEIQQELSRHLEKAISTLWRSTLKFPNAEPLLTGGSQAIHPSTSEMYGTPWTAEDIDTLLQPLQETTSGQHHLQTAIEAAAMDIALFMAPYHAQMHRIAWSMEFKGTVLGEPFRWSNEQPLHWEVIRLLHYITQGFYLLEDRGAVPWLQELPAYPETVDLSFLQTRALPLLQSLPPSAQARNQYHPGELIKTSHRVMDIKNFGTREYPRQANDDALSMVWNISVLMEYAERLLAGTEPPRWNNATCRTIVNDKKYRESILQGFSAAQLNHGSPLDQTIQFWEHGPFAALGGADGKSAKSALWLLKGYFTWQDARRKGYSNTSVPVFSMDNIAEVANRVRNTEVGKKMDHYFKILGSHSPERYMVLTPALDALDALLHRFPNFSEVTTTLRKTIHLLHLQEVPVLRLPNILLVGGPGLGKTRYLNALAKALKAPMHEIPMSTVSAGFVISGSDMTWHSAKPGCVANAFLYDLCANPLFILDEIDKASGSNAYDPYGPLYQLLEKHTAERFQDEALQLEIDASHCSWLATANDTHAIPEPILSRFRVFRIPALTPQQSYIVAQSIYDDLRNANAWGKVFGAQLTSAVLAKLTTLDARAMYFALLDACANASERQVRPIILEPTDITPADSSHRKPGFI